MADTLTLAGNSVIGLVNNTNQVLLDVGADLGSPAPDQATISSLLLDGDVITGSRYGNRTITLPFVVFATSRANLSATLDNFLGDVSAQTWQMVWTPNGCPSTVWNCFRATPTVEFSPRKQGQLAAHFTLTFQAQPFGFSAATQSTTVAATGGPAALQVDGMNSGAFSQGTLDTSIKYEGAGSCAFNAGTRQASRTITAVDISAYGTISVRVRSSAVTTIGTVALQLTDNAAHSASAAISAIPLTTGWALLVFPLSAFTGVDLTHVTAWLVQASAGSSSLWADDLRAFPAASVSNSTAEGGVLTVPAIKGSARTPVALVAAKASGAMSNVLLHSPPASQDSDLTIFAGLSSGSVTIPDANMNYNGTYTLVAFLTASATGAARTITATITQKVGATTIGTQTLVATVAGTQTLVVLGEVALPITPVPGENVTGSLIITLAQSGGTGTDTYSDVALLDTTGQTILLTGLTSALSVYADQPNPLVGVGPIYASTGTDRTLASSVANLATISGGPVLFEPGNNKILVASTNGAPNATITYTPAWMHEALV